MTFCSKVIATANTRNSPLCHLSWKVEDPAIGGERGAKGVSLLDQSYNFVASGLCSPDALLEKALSSHWDNNIPTQLETDGDHLRAFDFPSHHWGEGRVRGHSEYSISSIYL